MNARRISAVLLSITSIAVLAACGSSGGVTSGTTGTLGTTGTTGTSGTTEGPAADIEHSTLADDAIVRIGAPSWLPSLVIGGDGWAYQPSVDAAGDWTSTESRRTSVRSLGVGPTRAPAAAPAPPRPTPMERRLLTPEGVQIVLALADDLGLLAVPGDYEDPGVTDVGSTYVTLSVTDGTYEHVAYALGYVDETGDRRDLERFVDAVGDLEGLVGADNIGPAESYVPAAYAVSVSGSYSADGTDVTWPSDVAVAEGCVELPVDRFAPGVAGIYIADVDGSLSRVSVIPDLPGDACTTDSISPIDTPTPTTQR